MLQQLKAPILHISETRGKPVETAQGQATPIGRSIHLQLPFASVSWHRPLVVEVRQDDSTYRLPIYNATSRVTSIIFLLGLAAVLVPFVIQGIILRRRRAS